MIATSFWRACQSDIGDKEKEDTVPIRTVFRSEKGRFAEESLGTRLCMGQPETYLNIRAELQEDPLRECLKLGSSW